MTPVLVIIPCGAKKKTAPAPAYALYAGSYYRACLQYALSITRPEHTRILSAKYGLLALHERIVPYNIRMGAPDSVTLDILREQCQRDKLFAYQTVIALGGRDYTSVCRQLWPGCMMPLQGIGGFGYQMHWLKQHHGRLPDGMDTAQIIHV